MAAGNPGVNPLDPALARRFLTLEIQLNRAVLDALPGDIGSVVGQLWEAYERGELPLPLEYQQLIHAGNQEALFDLYHSRLRALDPTSAEAVRMLLEGHGILVGGAR